MSEDVCPRCVNRCDSCYAVGRGNGRIEAFREAANWCIGSAEAQSCPEARRAMERAVECFATKAAEVNEKDA